jgi:SAM-dependent methyltransferase
MDYAREYWETASMRHGESPVGAHSDANIVALENEFVVQFLAKYRPVQLLDMGCGNGQRTKLFSQYAHATTGIDFSANAIGFARHLEGPDLRFYVEDVLTSDWEHRYTFDCVVSCRCLINLGTVENQLRVIDRITARLPEGGLFIFCEGSKTGTNMLNSLRSRLGLDCIRPIPSNVDLDDESVLKRIRSSFDLIGCAKFGLYYFLTRCYYPAVILPSEPDPNSRLNTVAADMQRLVRDASLEQYGRHLCVAARKL